MKKIIILLAVVALCAGTVQAAVVWDIIDEAYGTGTGRVDIKDNAFNTLSTLQAAPSSETLFENYTQIFLSGTAGVLHSASSVVMPDTYTLEVRMNYLTKGTGIIIWDLIGSTADPAPLVEIDFNGGTNGITIYRADGPWTNDKALNAFAYDSWHTYTLVVDVSTANDDFIKLWIDDPTTLGTPDAEITGQSLTPGTTGNVQKFLMRNNSGDNTFQLDYVKMGTGIFVPDPIAGDVNEDGLVGGYDITKVIANWGETGQTRADGDLSGDGTVDGTDYSTILSNWGNTPLAPAPPEPPAVPEPATLLVLLSGALLAIRRR